MADDQPGPSNQAVANGDQQIVKPERKQVEKQAENIKSMLQAMALQRQKDGVKENYEFWETQPVAQFNEDPSTLPVSIAGQRNRHSNFYDVCATTPHCPDSNALHMNKTYVAFRPAARRRCYRCTKNCTGCQASALSSARDVILPCITAPPACLCTLRTEGMSLLQIYMV